jgi:hypothetical protein
LSGFDSFIGETLLSSNHCFSDPLTQEFLMTTKMYIGLLIVAFVTGPIVQLIWEKIDKRLHRPKRPEPPDPLQKVGEDLTNWLRAGKVLGVVDDDLIVKYEFDPENDRLCHDLKDWLKSAPIISLRHGETIDTTERESLERWFRWICVGLIAGGAIALLGIRFEWSRPDNTMAICFFSSMLGGCIAAFRSCLDRRANGFEDKYGNRSPEAVGKKQRFGGGMARWFIGRPVLSASVGLLLYFGLEGNVFPETLKKAILGEDPKTVATLVFYACLAGLLAKTLLDLFLEAGKKIFRVEE